MLKEYIEELVNEVLRGFNLSKFKSIAGTNEREQSKNPREYEGEIPELNYAQKMLPYLGQGTSRSTFALSGGKVLKIATNDAGVGQNQAEVEIWSNSKSPYITQVYDNSPDYKWIIAEIVKPLSESEMISYLSVDESVLQDITWLTPTSIESVTSRYQNKIDEKQAMIDGYQSKIDRGEGLEHLEAMKRTMQSGYQVQAKSQEILDNQTLLSFLGGMIDLVNNHGLLWGDIHIEHFGRNAQGQIKLLDYGYNDEVRIKYYTSAPSSPTPSYST